MWSISKEFSLSYAHRVFNQDLGDSGLVPKCRNLHGHDSKVIYEISSKELNNNMVLDYTLLKKEVFSKQGFIHAESLDHKTIISKQDPKYSKFLELYDLKTEDITQPVFMDKRIMVVSFVPTAETLAQFLHKEFELFLLSMNVKFSSIAVYFNETEGSSCRYTEDK